MCGIAGLMTLAGRRPDGAVLDRLAAALLHRGPDGQGRYVEADVGLAHTRLAIIDLKTGDQPLYAEGKAGGRLALVANGEIYNYVELNAALRDFAPATASDCEPILHLYRREGIGFARRLRGMYALALHDPASGRLILARDPFGIKPLYYAESEAGLAFASEPQALIRAGLVAAAIRPPARDELLQLQFTTGAETVFRGIRRVLPGETLVVERGVVVARHRIEALPEGGPRHRSVDEALYALDEVLMDSVSIHQRSDVPYGMFLSGGVDSTVLLAMMKRLNDRPVQAFTAGFPGTDAADERAQARAAALAVGAEHHEIEVGAEDFWNLLPAIAAVMDDPAADYAILPTYMLARTVRQAGLKVVLTGEGGDELFAGYGRYRQAVRPRLLGGRPMRRKGAFSGLGVLRESATPMGWRDGIVAAETAATRPGRTGLQVNQGIDCADWLPHDLLLKLDRCLMAFGVEGRVPFLDPAVADVAFLLPDRLKLRHGFGKWLLRRWLETGLPVARPFARKQGFTVPVGQWIASRRAQLGPLVAAQAGIREACRPGAVERLFDGFGHKHEQAAWRLLFYAVWHRVHLEGMSPEGDVFDFLARRS